MSAMNRDERQPSPASVERVLLVVVAFLTSGVIFTFFIRWQQRWRQRKA